MIINLSDTIVFIGKGKGMYFTSKKYVSSSRRCVLYPPVSVNAPFKKIGGAGPPMKCLPHKKLNITFLVGKETSMKICPFFGLGQPRKFYLPLSTESALIYIFSNIIPQVLPLIYLLVFYPVS